MTDPDKTKQLKGIVYRYCDLYLKGEFTYGTLINGLINNIDAFARWKVEDYDEIWQLWLDLEGALASRNAEAEETGNREPLSEANMRPELVPLAEKLRDFVEDGADSKT